jgi:hypothetical protein
MAKYNVNEKKALRSLIGGTLVGSLIISFLYLVTPYLIGKVIDLGVGGSDLAPFQDNARLIAAGVCFSISTALGILLSYVMVNNTHKAMEEENEIG